jgi:hypothetical protein
LRSGETPSTFLAEGEDKSTTIRFRTVVIKHKVGQLGKKTDAGIAGERIFTGRKKVGKVTFADWLGGAHSDLHAASKIIKEDFPGIDSDKFIDRCLATAWVILGVRRKAVEAIVNALIQKGYLSYDECKKIYEENQ